MISNLKDMLHRYSHAWVFLYWLIYLPWFHWLERTVTTEFYILDCQLDQYIPFCEVFIIPYLLWFPYVALTITWFFFRDKKDFYRLTAHLYCGMTLFLVICTVIPNGLQLRPTYIPRENIFTEMVEALWKVDTPTNVLPSIHVFNSMACCMAVLHTPRLKNKTLLRCCTIVLTVLIILATMFLKQHSVIDVVFGLTLSIGLYGPIYQWKPQMNRYLLRENL